MSAPPSPSAPRATGPSSSSRRRFAHSAPLALLVAALAGSTVLTACGGSAPPQPQVAAPAVSSAAPAVASAPSPAEAIAAAVSAPDRSADDRALDAGRRPAELLAFAGVGPGSRVAELGAGGGYTAELLARVVGATGKVYGQNPRWVLERFAEKPWSERLQKPALGPVVRVDREFDDPLPAEAKNLDAVFLVMLYHDLVWSGVDRPAFLRAVRAALTPPAGGAAGGLTRPGVFVVLDHSAAAGRGLADVETLHRIEESTLRAEVEAAGFAVDATSDAWRHPEDTRDWSTSPRTVGEKRGTSDRFAYRFKVK